MYGALKMWFCGRSLAGIAGSNPTVVIDVLSLVSVARCQKSLRRDDHSSRGVLPSVVCLSVTVKPWPARGSRAGGGGVVVVLLYYRIP
jgi:hypothetical protein